MEEDKKTLVHYCKNCCWKGQLENQSKCVYSRNYQDDFIANKVFSNKYTIYDKTLPRVSYTCINQECATNMSEDVSNVLFYNQVNPDWETEYIQDYLKQFQEKGYIVELKRMRLSSILIICDTREHMEEIDKFIVENPLDKVVLERAEFTIPKKEVMYIKYDSVNMKYLYICCVCGSSWKNT